MLKHFEPTASKMESNTSRYTLCEPRVVSIHPPTTIFENNIKTSYREPKNRP